MLLFVSVFYRESQAQTDEDDNLYLLIHPSFSEVYLDVKSRQNQNYLSLAEVLTILEIPFKTLRDTGGRVTSIASSHQGNPTAWMIDISHSVYLKNSRQTAFHSGDVLQDESTIYLKMQLFDSIFQVKWTLNQASMAIGFTSDKELPFQWRARNMQARRQLSFDDARIMGQAADTLLMRDRTWLGFGAIDFRYNIDHTPNGRLVEGRLTAGIELFGGDLGGSLAIQQTNQGVALGRQITNWRYVTARGCSERFSMAPTQLIIGRPAFSTIPGASARGIYVSNANVMPRKILGNNVLEGHTVPHSDVDLWFSGRLIDYTTADSLGRFMFRLPMNFGQSRVELKIYTPDGREIIEHRQLNIPFAFLPAGQINYQFQLGQNELSRGKWLTSGQIEAGIMPELSVRLGVHSAADSMGHHLKASGSIHARILQQYLMNISLDGQGNSRLTLGTVFSNRMSTNISYEKFGGLNQSTSDYWSVGGKKIQFQHIMPLSFKHRPLGFRIDGELTDAGRTRRAYLSADALWNQGPFTNRIQYKASATEVRLGDVVGEQWEQAQEMTIQSVFVVPRWKFVPRFIQGLNFRGNLTTDFRKISAQSRTGGQFRFSVGKNIGRTGRLQLNLSRPIRGQGILFGLNVQYDLRSLRTSTDWGTQLGSDIPQTYIRHSGMGSVMWDATSRKLIGSPAEQVGRAGLCVRFFMDENGNKRFDEGELIVPVPSARLDKSYAGLLGKDSLLRFLQLQSYWRYELQIDENTLPEADLVALSESYAFVACPNQTNRIDVPLYRAGSISGEVLQKWPKQTRPLGGVRIFVEAIGKHSKPISMVLRSYADGSFYIDRLQPGKYSLKVDQQQLEFMGGVVDPDSLILEIMASIDGHHHENVTFTIQPELPSPESIRSRPLYVSEYRTRLELRAQLCIAAFVDAQHHFYNEDRLQSLIMIDSSLLLFSTDHGLALKGTVYFVHGDTALAYNYWKTASSRNPTIAIPSFKGYSNFAYADSNRIDGKVTSYMNEHHWRNVFQSRARIAVASFVETQELIYQGCHREAGDMLDLSLSLFPSDHGLALRGTISFLMGQRSDAHKFWGLALQRNPSVLLFDPMLMNQLRISSNQMSYSP